MPSPFPGMDPWIENDTIFGDFHDTWLAELRAVLNAGLPAGYFAATNTIVWEEDSQRRKPDVSVLGLDNTYADTYGTATEGDLVGLLELEALDTIEERYLEIRTADGERLVTAIEVLSPTNKDAHSKGRVAYQSKQAEFREARVNLVEFDFLRAGEPTTMIDPVKLRRRAGHTFDYHIAVSMFNRYSAFHAAAIRLSDVLPTIGIPLDPGVPAVVVNLQAIFTRTYDTGRYGQRLKYHKPPTPPLTTEQQAWVDDILRAKGVT